MLTILVPILFSIFYIVGTRRGCGKMWGEVAWFFLWIKAREDYIFSQKGQSIRWFQTFIGTLTLGRLLSWQALSKFAAGKACVSAVLQKIIFHLVPKIKLLYLEKLIWIHHVLSCFEILRKVYHKSCTAQ